MFFFFHMLCMSCPSYPLSFKYQDSTWWWELVISLLVIFPVCLLLHTNCVILFWNTCSFFLSVMMPWSLVGGRKHFRGTYYHHSHDKVLGLQTVCFCRDSNWSCTVALIGNTEQRVHEKLLVQNVNIQSNPQCYLWLTDTDGEGGKNHWQHLTSKSLPPHAEMLIKCPLSLGRS
jgi:hypothetical protein